MSNTLDFEALTAADVGKLIVRAELELSRRRASEKALAAEKKAKRKKGGVRPLPIRSATSPSLPGETPPCSGMKEVATKILPDSEEWVPSYQTSGAANADLRVVVDADVSGKREINLPYRCCIMLDCGFSMQLPPGFKAEVAARSGWAKRGLVVLNSPAQIDPDYTGRVKLLIGNVGKEIIRIVHGERVAQIWVSPIHRFQWETVTELEATPRGDGGFGSTGTS